jgi:CRISPR system Cascade subunit CasB
MSDGRDVERFVRSRIKRLDADTPWSRAALAKLRRGIGKSPGETPEIWDITLADLSEELMGKDDGNPSRAEWAIHMALTFYALHRQGKSMSMNAEPEKNDGANARGHSFGAAVGRLRKPDGSNEQTLKRRFDAVITAGDLREFSHHARGMIQILRAAESPIPFDYPKFARDLYRYQFADVKDRVVLSWGEDFWGSYGSADQQGAEDEEGGDKQ